MNFPEGTSIREFYASQVISAVVRQCSSDLSFYVGPMSAEQYFADKAFAIADAMIERSKL